LKKPQWITIAAALILILIIYVYGRTTPYKTSTNSPAAQSLDLTDTILNYAKSQITGQQLVRITTLENSISRGAVKDQQLRVYHQLAHFWNDSVGFFLPYAWYEAESARLENSEKTLTFAAHLFLNNLRDEQNTDFRKWEALQAKDLFERSLKINPNNDSSKVGLGACYLFGNISAAPMEGISRIKEVLDKDSTNVYAQMMLAKGSMLSGQYDKAINRLLLINRLQPGDPEAILMLADAYEKSQDNSNAVKWYKRSLPFMPRQDMREAVERRIKDLEK
jgi:tetratricopeptide (TPR) repeat protein